MPPVESKANGIFEYVRSQLASMPNDGTYWYRPDRVARVDGPYFEYWSRASQPDASPSGPLGCFYMIYGGPLTDQTATTGTREKNLELHVVATRRIDGARAAGDDPNATMLDASPVTPTQETILDRLEVDVERRICAGDLTLGGRVTELHIPDRNRNLRVNQWDTVQVMFLMSYRHQRSQP